MSTAQRIQRARAALQAAQDSRYQRQRRTAQAVVTSVNRDSSTGHIDGTVWATIDGVSDQLIFVGAGTGISAGDVLRVENRGSGLAPDWTLIGKTTATQGAEGLVDIGRPLSTPTGLSLATAVYSPSAGNLRARLTATWSQLGTWEGVGSYRAQLRRDSDGSIQAATVPHDSSATTASLSWSELEPGIAYSVRVQALAYAGSASGWTSWSSTTTAADTTAPATPSGLSAAQVDARTLRATWTANTEADLWYYEIDAGLDGSASLGGVYPLATGTTTWAVIPTQPGVGIYLRLRATDTSGNASAWSSWAGPYTTTETTSLAGRVYLQPRAELIADLSSGASTVDVSAALFESGEFAHILTIDGATEEIVKFTSAASSITGGHRYTITRAADGGTAQAFDAGTPIYMLGQRGYILADSRDDGSHTDTPFLDIYAWDDPYTGNWADKALRVRLGKLDGITDPDLSPAGFGLYSTNSYLKGTLVAGNGTVTLDDDGISIEAGITDTNKIIWKNGGTPVSWDYSTYDPPSYGNPGASSRLVYALPRDVGDNSLVLLEARTQPFSAGSYTSGSSIWLIGSDTPSVNRILISTNALGINNFDFGGSVGTVVSIEDVTTAPTAAPSTGGIAYIENGSLRYKSSNGATQTIAGAIQTKTANYTAAITDHVILTDASAGAVTITLPTAVDNVGLIYHIKKTDSSANAVTIDGNGSETIDGATTQALGGQYDSAMIVSDGTAWHII